MAQYIDKSALVAEIERLKEQDYPCDTFEELRDRVFSEAMRENVEED